MLLGLAKFTTYTEDLKAGKLYMNNLEYYIDLEKESGVKGVGDKLEASRVFNDVKIRMYEQGSNTLVAEGDAGGVNFNLNTDIKKPVYCMFAIDGEVLEVISEDEEFYYTRFKIPENIVNQLVVDFGNKMLFMDPKAFIERVEATFEKKGYSIRADKVKYDDYNINNSVRMESYMKENNNDIYLWKDQFFKSQNEYRIIIPNMEMEGPLEVELGDISSFTTEFKINEFFSDKFELRLKK